MKPVDRLHSLVLDDRQGTDFRVHRDVFRDPEVFEWEMRYIFEGTWVFLGLESQIPEPHDYLTTFIGRQPVVVSRDAEGGLHCFLNSCRHRGALVCHLGFGNRKYHVCQYHGWAYDSSGRNVYIKDREQGAYAAAFDQDSHDLQRVPRLASYRGWMFASLDPVVPPLEEHLGGMRTFLDLVVDQGAKGIEPVPGRISYRFRGNWKLQLENGVDAYHFSSSHPSYIQVLERRRKRGEGANQPSVYAGFRESRLERGSFSFARGHNALWGANPSGDARPLVHAYPELVSRVGETRARWMLYTRNTTIFPNVQISENASLQLRIMRPISVGETEMTTYCIAPIGESPQARRQRIRQYEDFFNPSGLATPDDVANYQDCQTGFAGTAIGWQQGHARGLAVSRAGGNSYAEELGVQPERSTYGPFELGDETVFHACYREWLRLIESGLLRDEGTA